MADPGRPHPHHHPDRLPELAIPGRHAGLIPAARLTAETGRASRARRGEPGPGTVRDTAFSQEATARARAAPAPGNPR
jgi:hypothetical protein